MSSSLLLGEGKPVDDSTESIGSTDSVGGRRHVPLHSTARNTATATVFLVLAEAVGTGVLGLPGAASHLGWTLSIASLVLFAVAAFYSGVLLAEVKLAHPSVCSYADAAHLLCGRRFGRFTQGCILVSWGFGLVYYLIVTADAVGLVADAYLAHQWQKTLVAVALIALPAQCRDYHAIAYFALPSTLAIVVAVALVLTDVAGQGSRWGEATSAAPAAGSTFISQFQALSNFIFAYMSQSLYFQFMSEMKKPRQFIPVSTISYCAMLVFYSVTVVVAYGYQGTDVHPFLPAGMSEGPAKTVAAALLVFHVVIVYVVTAQPFTHFLHSKLFPRTLDERTLRGAAHWALLSLSYLGIGFFVANLIPFFSDVQALSGAIFGAPIVFGWPVLFYTRMCYRAGDGSRMGTLRKMGMGHALCCGFFFFVCCPVFCILGCIASSRDLGAAIRNSKPPFS